MEKNYYFLASSLPRLDFSVPPDISFSDLLFLLDTNLSDEDKGQTLVVRRYFDIENIRTFWKGDELDPHGIYDANELEDALVTGTGLPDYVYEYMEKFDKTDERIRNFPALISKYFEREIANASGILRDLLIFERECRLVLTGFRANLLGKDLVKELQFEDSHDEIVAQILAQKDAKTYEPPSRYDDLKALFMEHVNEPLKLYLAFLEYRFNRIGEMYGMNFFSIGRILGYLARLIIVEKSLELDKKRGLEVVDSMVRGEL
jgi:hypothetical protein